jgi:hypothetical protein
MLQDPQEGDTYCRAYKFDEAGNELVLSSARQYGSPQMGCQTCTAEIGIMEKGLRLTVVGYVSDPATTPPTFTLTEVRDPAVGCGDLEPTVMECASEAACPEGCVPVGSPARARSLLFSAMPACPVGCQAAGEPEPEPEPR